MFNHEAEVLDVYDSSATSECPTRVHDMVLNGKVTKITFNHGQPTKLPREQALKFLKDGFTVQDPEGHQYEPPRQRDEKLDSQLKPGETIARFEELSVDALKIRAAVLPGGEKAVKGKKEDLIAFLSAIQTAANTRPAGDDNDTTDIDTTTTAPATTTAQPVTPAEAPTTPAAASVSPAAAAQLAGQAAPAGTPGFEE